MFPAKCCTSCGFAMPSRMSSAKPEMDVSGRAQLVGNVRRELAAELLAVLALRHVQQHEHRARKAAVLHSRIGHELVNAAVERQGAQVMLARQGVLHGLPEVLARFTASTDCFSTFSICSRRRALGLQNSRFVRASTMSRPSFMCSVMAVNSVWRRRSSSICAAICRFWAEIFSSRGESSS